VETSELSPAADTLHALLDRGYVLAPKCRRRLYEHRTGPGETLQAEKLLVSGGPGALDEELRERVRTHQPELLAAACVMATPSDWMAFLVDRYRAGRLPLHTLAANVAGLMGKDPLEDGRRLEVIIEETLRA
jgi:hypothetical protein